MALELNSLCTVCKQLEGGDTVLLARLYKSSAYRGRSGEPLSRISKAYPQFSVHTLTNHTHYHQGLTSQDISRALMHRKDRHRTTALIKEAVDANSARNRIIEKGMERIESGAAKIEPGHVLAATKQVADIEAKQTDQQIEMGKMISKFMSGEEKYAGPDPTSGDIIDVTPTPTMGT